MVKGPNKSRTQYVNGGDSCLSDGNSDINCSPGFPHRLQYVTQW